MDVLPSEYYQVAYVDIGQVVDKLTAVWCNGRVPAADAGAATPGPATGSPANIRAWRQSTYAERR